MTINLHDLVLVHTYGDDPGWWEVVEIHGDHLICTNGLGSTFRVEYDDVVDVTDSDGPLLPKKTQRLFEKLKSS
jgi:hypothetical protein